MADLIKQYQTAKIDTKNIGQTTDDLLTVGKDSRRNFVRKWYDNNFFDDGYHFRYMSRQQNKVIDLSERATLYQPMRAIPKASRQIRGDANLLLSQNYVPVVYPEKVNKIAFENPQELQQAKDEAKRVAKLTGHWIEEEFKNQEITEKLALMALLTAKHGVSYMQITPDFVDEKIRTQVYDAFDIYLVGSLTEIYDSPFLIKAVPELISRIKANEMFDAEQREKINPDNKQASDEIKDAYMRSRFGREAMNDHAATLILKECYLEEYLTSENRIRINEQENGAEILQGKKDGDMVIRQVFEAGRVWLRDEYLNIPDYPFVDFRREPGPIYQVPLIERFIPANKSLDMLLSRAERYSHLMTTGSWSVKKGESAEPNNSAGGQIFEYSTTAPVQNQIASIPNFYFQLMGLLESIIEEQGVTTATLGKLPAGVKAARAIESLKESEYANLVIPSTRLKQTIRRIAEKMIDLADDNFVTPQTVYYLEKGEPQYFDIIGNRAFNLRQQLKVDEQPLDAIPVKKEYRVDIEVQNGLGYTREGRKDSAKEVADFMVQLAGVQMISPQAVQKIVENLLETYEFGPTEDVIEAMQDPNGGLSDQQVDAVKVAVMEVMKDLISNGVLPDQEQRIQEGKVAMAEVVKDTGLNEKGESQQQPEKGPSKSVSFKDLPPDGKVQLAAQAGIQLDAGQIAQDEAEEKQQTQMIKDREISLKEQLVKQKKGVKDGQS